MARPPRSPADDSHGAPSRTVHESATLRIGRFRCDPSHPRFHDSGPTGGHLIVFPREPVAITHAGRRTVLADPTRVMLYNRGQEYTRAALTARGDRCEWFSLPGEAVLAARRAHGPADGDEEAPFGGASFAPSAPRTYLLAQAIDRHLAGPRAGVDLLFVEEATLTLLDLVAASLAELEGRRVRAAPSAAHRRLAAAAERVLATRHAEAGLTLPRLAAELDSSPFHLARVFRRVTGRSLHAFRTALRLRAAVEPLLDGGAGDLTRLALELGFSSHSHFSAAFRATYGVTPSQLPRLPLARLSTILTA